MSYRPVLTGRALSQFHDLQQDPHVYGAFMDRVLSLMEQPWDAWIVYPDEPEFRQAQFGEHGLLSFRVDDEAEVLTIFHILWAG